MRVKPKTIGNGMADLMHNHCTTRPTPFEWQTDPFSFIWIVSGQAYP